MTNTLHTEEGCTFLYSADIEFQRLLCNRNIQKGLETAEVFIPLATAVDLSKHFIKKISLKYPGIFEKEMNGFEKQKLQYFKNILRTPEGSLEELNGIEYCPESFLLEICKYLIHKACERIGHPQQKVTTKLFLEENGCPNFFKKFIIVYLESSDPNFCSLHIEIKLTVKKNQVFLKSLVEIHEGAVCEKS
jgi:hypothetical protein